MGPVTAHIWQATLKISVMMMMMIYKCAYECVQLQFSTTQYNTEQFW